LGSSGATLRRRAARERQDGDQRSAAAVSKVAGSAANQGSFARTSPAGVTRKTSRSSTTKSPVSGTASTTGAPPTLGTLITGPDGSPCCRGCTQNTLLEF